MIGVFACALWATSVLLPSSVRAYIPAAAVNSTSGLVRSDQSSLDFVWVKGTYAASVSLQLTAAANQSDFFPSYWANAGIDRGALVHFSEDMVKNNDTSDTPWIAFISCDSNSTNMSDQDDIFTLARDRGAMAALLYSNKSEGCQIEQEYLSSFEQVLDVFTTHNRDDAIVIESQFEQHCDPAFQNFAPSLLNTSYESVTSLLNGTYPTSNTYLVAILTAFNATATVPVLKPTATASTSGNSGGGGGGSKPGTSTAMIILYAITGCITILFCVVIISGAVRAFRHPERYGPRRGRAEQGTYPYNFDDPAFGGPDGTAGEVVTQTRTAGLAKAIVDTFPIIKFVSKNKRNSGGGGLTGGGTAPKTLANETWEMPPVMEEGQHDHDGFNGGGRSALLAGSRGSEEHDQLSHRRTTPSSSRRASSSSQPLNSHGGRRGSRDDGRASYHSNYQSPSMSTSTSGRALANTAENEDDEAEFVVPVLRSGHAAGKSANGRRSVVEDERSMGKAGDAEDDAREHEGESCAICLLDFEEGDDLRVLPCEGQHQFHQECIDNWLLDISGNCPLCRKDFSLAPASSSTSSLPLTADPPAAAVAAGNPLAARVTRYLANVRSNRRERRISGGGAAFQQASGLSSMLAGTAMR